MSAANTTEPGTDGPPPNELDVFYKEWAKEAVQRDLTFLNEALARFVTLNVALAGGGLILLTDWNYGLKWHFCWAVVLFLIALLCALKGMLSGVMPDVCLLPAEQIRQHMQRTVAAKRWWLQRSTSALICGLALATVGVLVRGGLWSF
jgi:hypothetical protein